MTSTVTSKGQVTIPKNIRERLRLRTNDRVEFVLEGDRVLLVPVRTLLDMRGVVEAQREGNISQERGRAKSYVASRVREEMK